MWTCFVVRSQQGQQLKVQTKEIYYNQINLWSKLEEDVKMQSRLNAARVIHLEWHLGLSGTDSIP